MIYYFDNLQAFLTYFLDFFYTVLKQSNHLTQNQTFIKNILC